MVEVGFYFYFHYVIVPRANQRQPAAPYRDYPRTADRHKLLLRILGRLERQAEREGVPLSKVLTNFFLQWFSKEDEEVKQEPIKVHDKPGVMDKPALVHFRSSSVSANATETSTSRSSGSSSETSSITSTIDEEDELSNVAPLPTGGGLWTIPGLGHAQIKEFLAWSFFAKETNELQADERKELDHCLDILRIQAGLSFRENIPSNYKPRRLSLDDLSPIHRPLAVYIMVEALRLFAGFTLQLCGFRHVSSPDYPSLPGWYRPAKRKSSDNGDESQKQLLPLVFFHGIAPAGLAFYLPLVFSIVSDGRPTLLVEQPSISGRLGTFGALAEDEMMHAVEHMLEQTVDADEETKGLPILWAGHSFGSCPLTWMLRHQSLKRRTAGTLLMDPVTILLSEPAVVLNFLYAKDMSKIRIAAASEVFTEYYLRRHFAWYNAEAWVDPNADYSVTVALSGCDEIVDSPAVAAYLNDYPKAVRTIYWPAARHAHCVSEPEKWRQLQQALWQQEETYWRRQEQQKS